MKRSTITKFEAKALKNEHMKSVIGGGKGGGSVEIIIAPGDEEPIRDKKK